MLRVTRLSPLVVCRFSNLFDFYLIDRKWWSAERHTMHKEPDDCKYDSARALTGVDVLRWILVRIGQLSVCQATVECRQIEICSPIVRAANRIVCIVDRQVDIREPLINEFGFFNSYLDKRKFYLRLNFIFHKSFQTAEFRAFRWIFNFTSKRRNTGIRWPANATLSFIELKQ